MFGDGNFHSLHLSELFSVFLSPPLLASCDSSLSRSLPFCPQPSRSQLRGLWGAGPDSDLPGTPVPSVTISLSPPVLSQPLPLPAPGPAEIPEPRALQVHLVFKDGIPFVSFPPLLLLFLFIFIFYKTGEKSEVGWGEVTHFSTKVQNCL